MPSRLQVAVTTPVESLTDEQKELLRSSVDALSDEQKETYASVIEE